MTPMEAWHIISANLARLYKMRQDDKLNGYTDDDIEAEIICFKALQEMNQRSNTE